MTDRRPVTVRVDRDVWVAFEEFVATSEDKTRGAKPKHLENALREYLDDDRTARLESKIDEIHEAIVADEEKKKKERSYTNSASATTENRLQKIRATIAEETANAAKVHATTVEMAIRQHAGSSDPTIRRYKTLLLQDRELFEHPLPDKDLYFTDPTDFVLATNAATKGGKLRQDTYDTLLERYGEDWWKDQLPQANEKGFE